MNVDIATTIISANKGSDVELVLINGDSVFGTAFSVNSKGVNVKDDEGKTRSVALSRIDHIDVLDANDTFGSDDDADDLDAREIADLDELEADEADEDAETDEEIYAELHDGMTTAELAAIFSDATKTDLTPKELRVHLRALGLGVGKGRKYSLSATEYRLVKGLIEAPAN